MEEQEDKRGFKVPDRRRFSAEGEAKEGGERTGARAAKRIDIKSKPSRERGGDGVEAAGGRVESRGGPAAIRASRRPS